MDLNCSDGIINKNLAVNIDVSDEKSWDLNSGYTVNSLIKWLGAYSSDVTLYDFGLTAFDIGQTNEMESAFELTAKNNRLSLRRVGYNVVTNPETGDVGGYVASTVFDEHPINVEIDENDNYYFSLSGGSLCGFFKLDDHNYSILPSRYPKGITIENLLYLNPDSSGFFFTMGLRAEDKYSPNFEGETRLINDEFEGVFTSEGEYLHAMVAVETNRPSFRDYADMKMTVLEETKNEDNTSGNLISFGITDDKRLMYQYINEDNNVVIGTSDTEISTTGLTLVTIVYKPELEYPNDPELLECLERRVGDLKFYVNGRLVWLEKNFPEFYFRSVNNHRSKQIALPYTIVWGGGTFGLKHSWHYNEMEYPLYRGEDVGFIGANFTIEGDVEKQLTTTVGP
jgi:hypothetical protein